MKPIYFLSAILLFTNCAATKQGVSSIEFKTTPCFGACPIFTMNIAADGTATYNAEKHNPKTGTFKTTIKKEQLDSLNTLIQQANIPSLSDNYTRGITDMPTYYLIVTQNGKTKSIKDYGPSGPDELKAVYKFIIRLRENQNWQ